MKQLIVEIDDAVAAELERQAPSRSRKRSQFIRAAIRHELDAVAERAVAEAYRQKPDDEPAYFNPQAWEAAPPSRRPRR